MNRKKILIFSTISPVPVNRGDRIRLFQTAKNLSTFADVRVLFLDRAWESCEYDYSLLPGVEIVSLKVAKHEMFTQIAKSILQLKPYAVYKLITKRVRAFVRAQIEEFKPDIFWCHQIDAYPLFGDLKSANLTKVMDLVDSISLHYEATRAELKPSLKMRVTSNSQINLDKSELACIEQSDRLIISSDANLDYLHHKYQALPDNINVIHVHVDPTLLEQSWQFMDAGTPTAERERQNNLLFVGYLAYPPNELAVTYAIEEVLPKLQGILPVNLIVCGGGEKQLAQKYKHLPNVTFKGYVKDLSAEYLNASAMISPAPFASGIQNKLVEAMAIGLPSIISTKTVAANGVIDGQHVIACESAKDFARAVIDLMTNQDLADRLSANARMLVMKEHTPSVQIEKLKDIVAKVSAN
jgi:polysaccharide biosynthesis protein PslH